jgi:transcription elongation factor Elf1
MPRKSTSEYPPDWKEIARKCKDEAGWKCIRCGHEHSPSTGYTLTVHHPDMSPANCRWWNLLALCQRCHLQIQSKVIMERVWVKPHSEWFKPYVAGYYAFHNGRPDDKDEVMKCVDELIELGQGGIKQEVLL